MRPRAIRSGRLSPGAAERLAHTHTQGHLVDAIRPGSDPAPWTPCYEPPGVPAPLLARLKVAPEREHELVATTTRLGDWYGNSVNMGRTPLILAVSDPTLPVVLRARELRQIVPRLARGVAEVLRAIGAPADAIAREVGAMSEATICRTASRRVLGSMTEFAFMMEAYPKGELNTDGALVELSAWLVAGTPCSPIAMNYPRDVASAVLRGHDVPGVQ